MFRISTARSLDIPYHRQSPDTSSGMMTTGKINAQQAGTSADGSLISSERFAEARAELENRSAQQAAIGELAQAILTRVDDDLLIAQTCALVADTLDVGLVRVFERAGETLALRGIVGVAHTLEAEEIDAQVIAATMRPEPVVFDEFCDDRESELSSFLLHLGVQSAITAALRCVDGVIGVIGVYSYTPRLFKSYEIEFVQSIANVLGATIAQRRMERELETARRNAAANAEIESDDAAGMFLRQMTNFLEQARDLIIRTAMEELEPMDSRRATPVAQRLSNFLDDAKLYTSSFETEDRVRPEEILLDAAQRLEAYFWTRELTLEQVVDEGEDFVLVHRQRVVATICDALALLAERLHPGEKVIALVRDRLRGGTRFAEIALSTERPVFDKTQLQWQRNRALYPLIEGDGRLRLSLIHRVAEQHGGTVHLENREEGSLLTVMLPVFRAD